MAVLLVVFDAPDDLRPAFFNNGFLPFGKQTGAWFRKFDNQDDPEARDLEYEMKGVGMRPQWRPDAKE